GARSWGCRGPRACTKRGAAPAWRVILTQARPLAARGRDDARTAPRGHGSLVPRATAPCHYREAGAVEEGMEMRRGIRLGASLAVALAALAPRPAAAFGHLWEFGELYSNADGTVQFIEMVSDVAGENGLALMFIRSTNGGVDYHFSMNLVGDTLNKHVLIATAAFASQPGAVTPDYILPDGFLRSGGDTLSLWNIPFGGGPYGGVPSQQWDTYTYAARAIPTDRT